MTGRDMRVTAGARSYSLCYERFNRRFAAQDALRAGGKVSEP